MSTPIQEVIEALQADRKSRTPRFPVQALPAVRDSAVAEILGRHLQSGKRLVDIRALPYEATLGLIPVVFELEPPGGVALRRPSVLTLVDGQGHVAAVIDGFDPAQPNPYYGSPNRASVQPFVFQDESAADSMQFSEADLAPGWNRTREYVRNAAPTFSLGRDEGVEDTTCSESKTFGTALTAVPTVSGGLFFKTVDDSRTITQPDMSLDFVVDDSIVIDEPQLP